MLTVNPPIYSIYFAEFNENALENLLHHIRFHLATPHIIRIIPNNTLHKSTNLQHAFHSTIINDFRSRPHVFRNDGDRREFTEFIEKLSNATFENYDQLPMNRTFDIDSNQYLDLLWNLTIVFKPELNSGSVHKLFLQDTITELGICYAVNSKVAVYNSYR